MFRNATILRNARAPNSLAQRILGLERVQDLPERWRISELFRCRHRRARQAERFTGEASHEQARLLAYVEVEKAHLPFLQAPLPLFPAGRRPAETRGRLDLRLPRSLGVAATVAAATVTAGEAGLFHLQLAVEQLLHQCALLGQLLLLLRDHRLKRGESLRRVDLLLYCWLLLLLLLLPKYWGAGWWRCSGLLRFCCCFCFCFCFCILRHVVPQREPKKSKNVTWSRYHVKIRVRVRINTTARARVSL